MEVDIENMQMVEEKVFFCCDYSAVVQCYIYVTVLRVSPLTALPGRRRLRGAFDPAEAI